MTPQKWTDGGKYAFRFKDFSRLLSLLKTEGYISVGAIRENGALVLGEIESLEDLPVGYKDKQDAGKYELEKTDSPMAFGYVLGPQSWKKYLYPPTQKLVEVQKSRGGWKAEVPDGEAVAYAFIGIRPCELKALEILDKTLAEGPFKDANYIARREKAISIAVNCVVPGGTCFCSSMGTGPKAQSGYDIALTEVLEGGRHYFLAEAGSEVGSKLLAAMEVSKASTEEIDAADKSMSEAGKKMGRKVDLDGLKEMLFKNLEHQQWNKTAQRCLTCSNCTMVCPTCFCTTMLDSTDLAGKEACRERKWDSCFTMDYSYIHGGSIRYSTEARYRNWLTHKFSTWVDQFGVYGCVGCGRCITWCPAAIDITQEIASMQPAK